MSDLLKKKKIDPSESKQAFAEINLKLHCCRYWICKEWEFENMAFPFWRIYHNKTPGARVIFDGKTTEMEDDKIIIIPPNTSFSCNLRSKTGTISKENVAGWQIRDIEELDSCMENEMVDHLFIHFNLGMPYDFFKPGVYTISKDAYMHVLLSNIKQTSIYGTNKHDLNESLDIHIFVLSVLNQLNKNLWLQSEIDKRIMNCLQFIKENLNGDLQNSTLAARVNMSTNSFARLFKENTGESVQQYIIHSRIEQARLLLHHSTKSIDSIALECGFCDRHHFSKIFKQRLDMSPGYYKQHITIQ